MVATLQLWWARLAPLPCGRWIFSKIIGFLIPYTGTISPYVMKIEPGFAQVCIKEHRKVKNHLHSIHALAIANLGELTSGLAIHFAMDKHSRAILVSLSIEYVKKARGVIVATARIDPAVVNQEGTFDVQALLTDKNEVVVAKVTATWLLGKI